MKSNKVKMLLAAVAAASLFAGMQVSAEDFPSKQINLIIQASPGGLSDTTARTIAQYVEQDLGVPIVCTNKPGASGAVAMSYVSACQPEGYTIGYIPCEIAMIQALGYTADLTPESFDFIYGGNLASGTVIVRSDSEWETLEDLVAWCKEHPGELRVGTSGANSIWEITGKKLCEAAGIEMNFVSFDGAAPAVAALLGGHIDMVPVSEMEAASNLDSGELRLLATASEEESIYYPGTPTFKECGYDVTVAAWGSFACPKGVPEDVMDVLEAAFEKAVCSDEFAEFTASKKYYPLKYDREKMTEYAMSEYEFYSEYLSQGEE